MRMRFSRRRFRCVFPKGSDHEVARHFTRADGRDGLQRMLAAVLWAPFRPTDVRSTRIRSAAIRSAGYCPADLFAASRPTRGPGGHASAGGARRTGTNVSTTRRANVSNLPAVSAAAVRALSAVLRALLLDDSGGVARGRRTCRARGRTLTAICECLVRRVRCRASCLLFPALRRPCRRPRARFP